MVRKYWGNRVIAVILGAIFVLSLVPLTVQARTAIDIDSEVSLTIEYVKDEVKLSGAIFDVYKVADSSKYAEFSWTEGFEECESPLQDLDQTAWAKLAQELVDYINENTEIKPLDTGSTDEEGIIAFPNDGVDMTPGLYLVIGQIYKNSQGTYKCSPFLISIPNIENDDTWEYHPVAKPKADFTEADTSNDTSDKTGNSRLPQTGMLWWPVPLLAGLGMLFFMIGWIRRQKSGE